MKAGKRYPIAAEGHCYPGKLPAHVEMTGEFRSVGPGEWYVSGAIPEGYYTAEGIAGRFWIARPVSESEHSPPTMADGLALVIDNHRDGRAYAHDYARDVIDQAPECEQVQSGIWTVEQAEVYLLADAIKDMVEWEIDDMPLTTFRDCVRAQLARDAFEEVDWHDLARHYLNVVKEG